MLHFGGIQFFLYEETVLGRTILAEYEVPPWEVDTMRKSLQESVRIHRQDNPNKVYGYQEVVITNQPTPGAEFQ